MRMQRKLLLSGLIALLLAFGTLAVSLWQGKSATAQPPGPPGPLGEPFMMMPPPPVVMILSPDGKNLYLLRGNTLYSFTAPDLTLVKEGDPGRGDATSTATKKRGTSRRTTQGMSAARSLSCGGTGTEGEL